MSLYIYTQPIENSLFDVFEDDFYNSLISRNTCGHLGSRRGCYRNPFNTLEKQLNKLFENEKMTDFYPKINLSEDEKNFYIHADLPGMLKEQVNIEVNEDGILSISGERENVYENNNNTNQAQNKGQEKESKPNSNTNSEKDENEMETEPTESSEQNQQQEEVDQEKRYDHKYSVKECSYGSFSRSFTLPENANRENIQAKMENGVLEIIIRKIETPKNHTRSIQIN